MEKYTPIILLLSGAFWDTAMMYGQVVSFDLSAHFVMMGQKKDPEIPKKCESSCEFLFRLKYKFIYFQILV